jgi:hypothetical protein
MAVVRRSIERRPVSSSCRIARCSASHPASQPTKFDFVIDLQAAETLGLTVPAGLLAAVNEVIEQCKATSVIGT